MLLNSLVDTALWRGLDDRPCLHGASESFSSLGGLAVSVSLCFVSLSLSLCLSLFSLSLSFCFLLALSLSSLSVSLSVLVSLSLSLSSSPPTARVSLLTQVLRLDPITGPFPQHPGASCFFPFLSAPGQHIDLSQSLPDSCAPPDPCFAQQHKKIKELQMAPFPPRAQIPVLNGWTDFQFGDRTQTQTAADEDEEVALVGGGWHGRARPAGGCWFCPGPPVTVVPLPAAGWGPEAPGAAGEQQASHQTYHPVWACDCSDRTWNCKQQSKMAGRTVVGVDVLAEGTRPGWEGLAPEPCRSSSHQSAWTLPASRAIRKNGRGGTGFCDLPREVREGPWLRCVWSPLQHADRAESREQ